MNKFEFDEEFEDDLNPSMQHNCGLFACVSYDKEVADAKILDVAGVIGLGLVGLQHRGQESAGIVVGQGESSSHPLRHHRAMGEVSQVLSQNILQYNMASARLGIGHTRYSTMGASEGTNTQPFIVETTYGQFAIAHNGELVNSQALKQVLLRRGIGLSTGTDTEVMTQLLCGTPDCGEPLGINWVDRIKKMMAMSPLSYSLLILYHDRIYAVRDPYGNRPLCIGKIVSSQIKNKILSFVVSSESSVFLSMNADLIRDVKPGEIVEIRMHDSSDDSLSLEDKVNLSIKSLGIVPRPPGVPTAMCLFEYVYFARPDSNFEGQQVYGVRFRSGMILARESPVEADVISVIPDSAMPAALGYSKGTGIPFAEVLSRNRFIGRTFIQPSNHLRQSGVAKKFGVLAENFQNKRVVIVDDSIVRGNTIKPIVQLLRLNGAKEVHVRIASPPVKYPCFMGINIPTRDELIANSMNSEQLAKHVGADSVAHLTIEGLHEATEKNILNFSGGNISHCNACFTGKYPVPLDF